MKKLILILTILIGLSSCIQEKQTKIETEYDKYISYLGKHIIIENDTFLIMDYSFTSSNYTLSNNKVIHEKTITIFKTY